ncbi:NAD(P)H-binding protein [Undibacterium pigrum]|uniref:Uncharacterized protein YbjT (DUF2867 family) n=1 Tax=Undibacterium pigrum TaxID=401470 RepID=A0A318J461_9BURK|nr:NAD(P)H-binding protein [Undibacterium pigrum]PXX38698.1 uncharacterized protein YbjT (DUF2867 family) [Undibacterium pigrum]
MSTQAILVIGSTGKTGQRVAARLAERNLPLRLGSRSGATPFDWSDRSTWSAALQGVRAAYVSFYPDLAVPGAPEAIQAFTDLAASLGVRRLVLLSGRGEPEAQQCEDIVRHSGLEWTILRASWFAQNFSEGHFLEPVLAGVVALPVTDVAEPFLDVDDIADVAAAALTEDRHIDQLYELTGPRLWTFRQAISEIAHATGRKIDFISVSSADYTSALEQAQLDRDTIKLINYLFSEVLDGRNTSLADGVSRALGRPAREFADYVRTTAQSGIWNDRSQA